MLTEKYNVLHIKVDAFAGWGNLNTPPEEME